MFLDSTHYLYRGAEAMDTTSLCQDGRHPASKVVQRRGDCKEGGPQNKEKNCVSFLVECQAPL